MSSSSSSASGAGDLLTVAVATPGLFPCTAILCGDGLQLFNTVLLLHQLMLLTLHGNRTGTDSGN